MSHLELHRRRCATPTDITDDHRLQMTRCQKYFRLVAHAHINTRIVVQAAQLLYC